MDTHSEPLTGTLRPARFSDLPALTAFFEERWSCGAHGNWELDEAKVQGLLAMAIQHHGRNGFIAVWEEGGRIMGCILGSKVPIYLVTHALEATDHAWIIREGASPWAGQRLLQAFDEWAWADPRVVRVRHAMVDTMGAISPGGVRILEYHGFRISGAIYEKERTP